MMLAFFSCNVAVLEAITVAVGGRIPRVSAHGKESHGTAKVVPPVLEA